MTVKRSTCFVVLEKQQKLTMKNGSPLTNKIKLFRRSAGVRTSGQHGECNSLLRQSRLRRHLARHASRRRCRHGCGRQRHVHREHRHQRQLLLYRTERQRSLHGHDRCSRRSESLLAAAVTRWPSAPTAVKFGQGICYWDGVDFTTGCAPTGGPATARPVTGRIIPMPGP